jgi:hypothetical protein
MLGFTVPTAEAAPYVASCNSGVLAPQICTFVASAVVAGFATPGQYLVLTRVPPSYVPPCPEGRPAHVEEFRGRLRGKFGVRTVTLTLHACPDAYPVVSAGTDDADRGYGVSAGVVGPQEAGNPASFGFFETDWYETRSTARGDVFRRNTGMSSYASGISEECPMYRDSKGLCDSGGGEFPYNARVDSSISGHWARLQLVVSGESYDVEDRTVKVTSQPYGNGGWKITRVS